MSDPYDSLTFGNSLSVRVDGAVSAMSLSPNGRDAVLAGRRGLFIIDLDDPFRTPRWLRHITSWEVADVQWSPHHAIKPSWCISTSNQKALLWDLARPANNAIQNVLHRHTRAITDINFHPLDPELLATCSIDTFIFSWDMRTPRRPVGKWAEWRAGATQIKWNHSNPHQIASSHDHSFYLWDSRNGARPVLHIDKAHEGKINGLDFSRGHNKILTCSNDKSVKYWDLNSPLADGGLQPTVVIKTDFPVARARSLPFGNDHSCGIMPVRGGDNAVHIVNYESVYESARALGDTGVLDCTSHYSFKGHNGPIKDFLWRTRHEAYANFDSKHSWKEYQLVTWSSQDFDLKLWPHDDKLYNLVNYNPLHQQLMESLVVLGLSGSHGSSLACSKSTTPASEISEDSAFAGASPIKYTTYCTEPPLSLRDISKDPNGDTLSSLVLIKIKQSEETSGGSSQLNHLTWISGVRMGRTGSHLQENLGVEKDDGPSNLGEEVSIVGHKFPKIRFEKISVSTGHLVMSLRGPLPLSEEETDLNISATLSPPSEERKDSIQDNVTTTGSTTQGTTLANAGSGALPATAQQTVSSGNNTSSISQNIPTTISAPIAGVSNPGAPTTTATRTQLPASAGTTTQLENATSSGQDASAEQKLIFIRLEIQFPKMYPYLEQIDLKHKNKKKKYNEIKFDIEETHELTAPIKKQMLSTLDNIAQFYSNKYNEYCLEPCLRYLLGDKIELDDSLMLDDRTESEANELSENEIEVGDEGWVDDLINEHEAATSLARTFPVLADEEDEEDDDLIPAINDKLSTSQEIPIHREEDNLSASRNLLGLDGNIKHDTTPLPKGCGAVWAETGQLVCFFIPKGDNLNEAKHSLKVQISKFKGSGLGTQHRVKTKNTHDVINSHAEISSDDEDSSQSEQSDSEDDRTSLSSESSDDSLSNDWNEMLHDDIPSRSRMPGMFKGAVSMDRKFLREASIKSSIDRAFSGAGPSSNYKSSAHGETSLRSTKRAKKSGKGAKNVVTILDFSHLMPDKYELACQYRVLGDSPENLARYNSEVALSNGYSELSDVWKIVEMILIKHVGINDVPDLIKDTYFSQEDFKGRFFWGAHPFGYSWLIVQLFEYFEKAGNLQMLAMLSCILFENISNLKASENGTYKIPVHTPYSSLPQLLAAIDAKENRYSVRQSRESLANGSLNSHPATSDEFSLSRKPSVLSAKFDIQKPPSIPNSIENFSRSSSPVILSPLKKGYGSYTPLLELSFQWEQPSFKHHRWSESYRRPSRLTFSRKEKSILPRRNMQVGYVSENTGKPKPPPSFTIEMKNVESLDLYEHVYSGSLLSKLNTEKIMSYRERYADSLFLWGLPFNRIKILKFNYPEKLSEAPSVSTFGAHTCEYGFRYRKAPGPNQQLLAPITSISTARNNSWNTSKRNKLQYCGLCGLVVSKRVVLCIHCEHVLHSDCAASWWFSDEGDNEPKELKECPVGCGCNCLDYKV